MRISDWSSDVCSSDLVELCRPQRGAKRQLIDNALHNAREALARRLAESSSQRKLLEQVAEIFGLDGTPERIEVYDNSHTQGSEPYGCMIVAGPEGFQKNAYRKFKIRDPATTAGDDYAMMREVRSEERTSTRLNSSH